MAYNLSFPNILYIEKTYTYNSINEYKNANNFLYSRSFYLNTAIDEKGNNVGKYTTENLFSDNMYGSITGKIAKNNENVNYNGTIKVFYSNNGYKVYEGPFNGPFEINGLNESLKYDIHCIPSETNYMSKVIYEYSPSFNNKLDIKVIEIDKSQYIYNSYYKIIKILGVDVNNTSVSVITNNISSIVNLHDNIFKIEIFEPTKNSEHVLRIIETIEEKERIYEETIIANAEYGMLNIDFTDSIEYNEGNTVVTTYNNPLINSSGITIKNNENGVLISNPLFNVGTTDFNLSITFSILSRSNYNVTIFSTNFNKSFISPGNIVCEVTDNKLSFRLYDGANEFYLNTISFEHTFIVNKTYRLDIVKVKDTIYIYLNNIIKIISSNLLSYNFNFLGGIRLGSSFLSNDTSILYKNFNFSNSADPFLIDKNLIDNKINYKDMNIYFNSNNNIIIDENNYQYSITDFTAIDGKYQKSSNKPVNYNGTISLDDFTIEIFGTFGTTSKQYIIYSDRLKLYINNNTMILEIDGIVIADIEYASGSNQKFRFTKSKNNLYLHYNDVTYGLVLVNNLTSILMSYPTIMSKYNGDMKCEAAISSIRISDIAYNGSRLGSLYTELSYVDAAVNETFSYQIKNPKASIEPVTWTYEGKFPLGLTLSSSGLISGVPYQEGTYEYTLKCTDNAGRKSEINLKSSIGRIVSLHHFEGANASTTIVDETGKIWTSATSAQISTTQKKFGNSSCSIANSANSKFSSPESTDFNFGTDEFTISVWVYNTVATNTIHRNIITKRNSWGATTCAWTLMRYANTGIYKFEGWSGGSNGSNFGADFGTTPGALNTWEFLTVSRKGAYLYLGLNGKIVNKAYFPHNIDDTSSLPIIIGNEGQSNANMQFAGFIDELKIVKGAAIYTEDHALPTIPSDYPIYNNIVKPIGSGPNYDNVNNTITLNWT